MPDSRSVYSTALGRLCPECGQAVASCKCSAIRKQAPGGDGIVRISRETKGRRGKGVTLVSGLPQDAAALKQQASTLKQLCGTGGTLKDGIIEIQGDQRAKLLAHLQKAGYTVKLAGG
jgi:translation initiation factor 1